MDAENSYFKLAYEFVNETGQSVYLTGKAGTGKTTFLKYVKEHCSKNLVVVAPTGVAAINARGVTMHSFFQLPLNAFVAQPDRGYGLSDYIVDKATMLRNLRFSTEKRRILQELQLLIIDEVSMLRSDMLEAIDVILRAVRKTNRVFGGVQVLFIGDLYQLPPVVSDHEKEIFEHYYTSPFFFHARAFAECEPVYIELQKVYRQTEQEFIDLLNNIRGQNLSEEDYRLLNSRYQPFFSDQSNRYITLTSHNYKADTINNEQLMKLEGPIHEYRGEIRKDFNEKQLPTEMLLRLKVGAQVMFIRNDSSGEKRYYNGKIGIVHKLHKDTLEIRFPDTDEILDVERETWDHISYSHNETNNQVEEKILGQFIQFPLRLAWAITIHKSQGLTFQHAIIDAGQSFAPGQVYVALSRCTSLDGIVLLSAINANAIHSDRRILHFNMGKRGMDDILKQLEQEKFHYQLQSISNLFRWNQLYDSVLEVYHATMAMKGLPPEKNGTAICKKLLDDVSLQQTQAARFSAELDNLFIEAKRDPGMTKKIRDRLAKAIEYFVVKVHDDIVKVIRSFAEDLKGIVKVKKYLAGLQEAENQCWKKIDQLQYCHFNGDAVLGGAIVERPNNHSPYIKSKVVKGQSARESLAYFMAGKTIAEIAKFRNISVGTVEGHLSQFISEGELDIHLLMTDTDIDNVQRIYESLDEISTTEIIQQLNQTLSYGQVRMAINYLLYTKRVVPKPYKPVSKPARIEDGVTS